MDDRWRQEIICALKVFYYYTTHAEQDLMLGILHPGGGQYPCLSIIDRNQVLVHMNRHGSATTFFPRLHSVRDFGEKARKAPEKVAASLFGGSGILHSYGHISDSRAARLRMIAHMIGLLDELRLESVDLRWGYFDSAEEGSFSTFSTFPNYFPPYWEMAEPVNTQHYDWAANILQVIVGNEIVATYNQMTAEVLLKSGTFEKF